MGSTDRDSEPTARPAPDAAAVGMPRWVKVFLIVAAALLLIMIGAMLLSGGQHGPGRHVNKAVTSESGVGWVMSG